MSLHKLFQKEVYFPVEIIFHASYKSPLAISILAVQGVALISINV